MGNWENRPEIREMETGAPWSEKRLASEQRKINITEN